jgi:integrase
MPKLTERFISEVKPNEGQKDRLVFDSEVKGLGLRATASGSKVFLCQWQDKATGRKVREVLGAWGSITLEQARDAARVRLGRLAQGFDPRAELEAKREADKAKRADAARAKEEAAFTMERLIEDWAKLHLAKKAPRYSTEAERALRVAFAAHLAKPAGALTHSVVQDVLDAIATDGRAAMASRTLAYGRACYGWAVKRRRLAMNPFAGLPAVEGGNPERDRVLTDAEIGAIWRAAGDIGAPFGPITRLLLLTAQRREEVAGMRWSEISADLTTWTLPGERTKNGKTHIVQLAEPARAVLASVRRIEGVDLVFTTTGKTAPSGFSKAKLALDAAMAREAVAAGEAAPTGPGWRFHDCRRSAVTWLAESGFGLHVADRLLNHVSGVVKGAGKVYQQGQFLAEREAALMAWGRHVLAMGEGVAAAINVTDLGAARAKKAVGGGA